MRVTELAAKYKMAKSTICTILKKKDVLKNIDVAKGVTNPNKAQATPDGRGGKTFTGVVE